VIAIKELVSGGGLSTASIANKHAVSKMQKRFLKN